jgi:hypothetical protein
MAGTLKRIAGPAYLASSATDIYTPPASTIYTVIKHIHINNKTNSAAQFHLYVGATGGSAGGTELFGGNAGYNVPANSSFDYYCNMKMTSTDFLSGLASAGSTLVIIVEGEQFVV